MVVLLDLLTSAVTASADSILLLEDVDEVNRQWRTSCGRSGSHTRNCGGPSHSDIKFCCSADTLHYSDLEKFTPVNDE